MLLPSSCSPVTHKHQGVLLNSDAFSLVLGMPDELDVWMVLADPLLPLPICSKLFAGRALALADPLLHRDQLVDLQQLTLTLAVFISLKVHSNWEVITGWQGGG